MHKHRQIYLDYRGKVLSGELKEGDRLPTEKEICGMYHVSRITAMRALNDLAMEGLVIRVPGKGTRVATRSDGVEWCFSLIVPHLRTRYYGEMASAFCDSFKRYGLVGTAFCAGYDVDYTLKLFELQRRSPMVKGVAMVPGHTKDYAWSLCGFLEGYPLPVVVGSRELEGFEGAQVVVDEFGASLDAFSHLVRLGHKRIAYVGRGTDYTPSNQRYMGFKHAVESHRLRREDCPIISHIDTIAVTGIRELFNSSSAPTAILAAGESFAMQMYDVLKMIGLRVPEDVAIVVLDGGVLSTAIEVPMTASEFPGRKIGAELAEALRKEFKGEAIREKVLKVRTDLVVRASCGTNPVCYRHEYLRNWLKTIS